MPWLSRIIENKPWCKIINEKFNKFGGLTFLLRCDYDAKGMHDIPLFYREMLLYASYILLEPHSTCIIWNNKNITINGKSIYWDEWRSKGVIFIHHLQNDTGQWLDHDSFEAVYNIRCNFLTYRSLISAVTSHVNKSRAHGLDIPNNRPSNINFESNIFQTILGYKINLKNAKSRDFYQLFVSNNVEPPTSMIKWQEMGVSNDIYLNSIPLAREATKEPRLISVHYKIINNIWPTGEKLFKWKIRPDDKCHKCGEKDTIEHTLCECADTRNFLIEIFSLIDRHEVFTYDITMVNLIFGVEDKAVNTILLTLKYYIVTRRCQEQNLISSTFMKHLYMKVLSEKKFMSNTSFSEKWDNFPWIIDQAINYANELNL